MSKSNLKSRFFKDLEKSINPSQVISELESKEVDAKEEKEATTQELHLGS